MSIQIADFQVMGVESGASVNIGTQFLYGGGSTSKTTMGAGSLIGDYSAMPVLLAMVSDPDVIDNPSFTDKSGWF